MPDHPTWLRSMSLVVSANCDLRCRYCYQNRRTDAQMPWEVARRAIDLLLSLGHRDVTVEFIGGEPLLAFCLLRRAVAYVNTCRSRDMRVGYALTTNGVGLTPRRARFLERHGFKLSLSVDGIRQAQALRGEGTHEIVDRRIDELRSGCPRLFADGLTVTMTLLPETVPSFAASVAYLLRKGVPRITVAPAFGEFVRWRVEQVECLEGAIAEVAALSLEHQTRTGCVPLGMFRRPGADPPRDAHPLPMCGVGSGGMMTVDVDGTLYGCAAGARSYQVFRSSLAERTLGALKIGHLDDADLGARLAGFRTRVRADPVIRDRTRKYSSYGACRDCAHLGRCQVCPAAVVRAPGNDDPDRIPDFQCAFNRVAWTARERYPDGAGSQVV